MLDIPLYQSTIDYTYYVRRNLTLTLYITVLIIFLYSFVVAKYVFDTEHNNKTAFLEHSRTEILNQLTLANELQHTEMYSMNLMSLMGQFPTLNIQE